MNPFYFTKFRLKLFLGLLIFPFPLALVIRFIPIIGSYALLIMAIPYLLIINLAGLLFGSQCFEYQEFGALPQGFCGWSYVFVVYVVIAFFASWYGNRYKDTPTDKALSTQK